MLLVHHRETKVGELDVLLDQGVRADDQGTPNPLGDSIRHAMAFGGSQSGRYLRHFIELGMNKDARGRRVFDGVYTHTAGAGKVFANHVFAEPDRTFTQHEDHLYPADIFPFTYGVSEDPFSKRRDGILALHLPRAERDKPHAISIA